MSTPRDLLIVATDITAGRPVEQGDLALALAGAELIDLLGAGVLAVDGDRIVPGAPKTLPDPLLDEAGASLVRTAPYESVEDWLWRRGRGLSSAYLATVGAEGRDAGRHRRWLPGRSGPATPGDAPARRRAADRWASGEPVLAVLAAAVGIHDGPAEDLPGVADEAVETVLAAVGDAVTELEAVRQRRTIENAAFDNIWRGP